MKKRTDPRNNTERRWRIRPSLECLENRLTPAGNVAVAFAGTTLVMGGDALGNHVLIRSGDAPGEIVVGGIDTTVDGQDQQTFSNVDRIFADFRAGDDWLETSNLTLSAADVAIIQVDM